MIRWRSILSLTLLGAALWVGACRRTDDGSDRAGEAEADRSAWARAEDLAAAVPLSTALDVGAGDWPQWGGSPARNHALGDARLPADWSVGESDPVTGAWTGRGARNIRWITPLGSQSYGNPVIANGRVYVGTNNDAGYVDRYPPEIDLGVLLCLDERDGRVQWQHSSEKLETGSDHDWPEVGICSSPLVDGERLWYVTSRCEVACLDAAGFHDGENDGPYTGEPNEDRIEADVVWVFDMIAELGVRPHNMSNCSVTAVGDLLFVSTSNGTDEDDRVPALEAPSFICLDRDDGRLVWSDASPGGNLLHGQWSSPAYVEVDGVPQVVFAGGDGWLYSFLAARGNTSRPGLLWRFDCNEKASSWEPGGGGDRNNILTTPVAHEGRIYVTTGQDPSYGTGEAILWCVDPARTGDVSPTIVVAASEPDRSVPHRRLRALDEEAGEVERPNPDSAAIWKYTGGDLDGSGKLGFAERLHRSTSTVAIRDGLLVVADLGGVVHCLDAATGVPQWTHDLLTSVWGSPLIADGRIYIGDADGMVTIFEHDRSGSVVATIDMGEPVYSTPVAANGVLYVLTSSRLVAVGTTAGPLRD